jgi:hypothetical protein
MSGARNRGGAGVASGNSCKCTFRTFTKFFKFLNDPGVLRRVAGPGAYVREAELLEDLAHRPLVIVDAEARADHRLQIDAAPTHDPVRLRIGPCLDDLAEFPQLLHRQTGLWPLRAMIEETLRPFRVEPVHPVAQRLTVHAADLGGLAPRHAITNRRQRQQSPALVRVPRPLRQSPKFLGRKIFSKLNRSSLAKPSMAP